MSPHRLIILPWLLGLLSSTGAQAQLPLTEPPRCAKADYAKSRRQFQAAYDGGQYAQAVQLLRGAKERCWESLDATTQGWLVSDLGLASLRAGQPEACRQVLSEAPRELDPTSRVARAIAHNRGLCAEEAPSASAPASEPAAVKVLGGLQVSSVAEAAEALSREWRSPYALREGALPARRTRELRRCTDLEGVTVQDVDVTVTRDVYAFQVKSIRCRALRRLSQARPSRVSHVRAILESKDPGAVLPAALAQAVSDEDVAELARAQRAGRSWRDADASLRFESPSEGAPDNELRVQGEEYEGSLEWWAAGDFNADGYEDLLVYRSLSVLGGTLSEQAAFVLTCRHAQGVLEILERMD